jgi:hypothetical protein
VPVPTRRVRRVRADRRSSRRRGDDGVTLVEVLIAIVILLITMLPMGILLTSATSASVSARQRQAALQLADSWVEILSNSQPPTGVDGTVLTNQPTAPVAPAGTQAPPSTLAGTNYTVTAAYAENLVNDVGQSDLCAAGQPPSSSHPGVILLRVTVYWSGGQSEQQISVSTEINYPKPGLQTQGFLAINLTNDGETDVWGNSAATRLSALPVTVTEISGGSTESPTAPTLSPNPYTLFADPNGCIFAQVPVGTYDVAIQQPTAGTPATFVGYPGTPQFVDTSGSSTDEQDNQVVTVTAEQTVQLDAFDEGITAGVSYGGATAIDEGVQCPNAAGLTCVATGDGASGATATWGAGGSTWQSANLAAGSHINQVACTTAVSAECVGVGYGSTGGLIETTTSDANALSADVTPAGVTDVTQVVCPSADGCYALATTAAGPELLAGRVGPGPDTWVALSLPGVTATALDSIACPTSTTCELAYAGAGGSPGIVRLDGDPALLGVSSLWTPVVTNDSLSASVQSLGTIVCPSTTQCLATAVGDATSPSDATLVAAPIALAGGSSWTNETSFPTGASSVTDISCASSTCVAIGTVPAGPAVWTGSVGGATDSWAQATSFPSGIAAVTSVACGIVTSGDNGNCAVAAITSGAANSGVLLQGSLLNGGWAWNPVALPSGVSIQYFVGVSCENPTLPTNATCAAVGATPSGPVVLATSNGTSGTWTNVTPLSLVGSTVTGISLQTAPAVTSSWTTQVAAGQAANATTLPNVLYPAVNGYSISTGDCSAEAVGPSALLNAAPGGTASATVPLGLLPIELVSVSGTPVVGATITLTSVGCPIVDTYNLPVTDGEGYTNASVPYGTYSYSVTSGSASVAHTNVTLTVGVNSVQSSTGGVTLNSYLPAPLQVQA